MPDKRRVVLDCRDYPQARCSVAISGTEEEVLELGELHATTKHGMKKEPGLRAKLRSSLKEEAVLR
jgi:hypothetical protein